MSFSISLCRAHVTVTIVFAAQSWVLNLPLNAPDSCLIRKLLVAGGHKSVENCDHLANWQDGRPRRLACSQTKLWSRMRLHEYFKNVWFDVSVMLTRRLSCKLPAALRFFLTLAHTRVSPYCSRTSHKIQHS